MKGATEKATFGGGCHVETAFRGLRGVVSACVGYMDGTLENPTYEDVCTGLTGYVSRTLKVCRARTSCVRY